MAPRIATMIRLFEYGQKRLLQVHCDCRVAKSSSFTRGTSEVDERRNHKSEGSEQMIGGSMANRESIMFVCPEGDEVDTLTVISV